MDELDLLKKAWKKEHTYDQVSEKELYAMLHRKSSSIVKWILVISVVEVFLWTLASCFVKSDHFTDNDPHSLDILFDVLTYFSNAVVLVFIYLFYRNYVGITATASTKTLMADIVRTRRTVQWYVGFQLAMFVVAMIIAFYANFQYNADLAELKESGLAMTLFFVFVLIAIAITAGLFWLFYRLLYGILLRKLYRNYNELKKIDL